MRKPSELTELQVAVIREEAGARRHNHETHVVTLVPIQIAAWGDIIDAIKAEGWKLQQFALAPAGHAVAVFEKAPPRINIQMDRRSA